MSTTWRVFVHGFVLQKRRRLWVRFYLDAKDSIDSELCEF